MAKNIILLADGTGNSASKPFKTNVWRLYDALDLNSEEQVASFSDGVGTSSFRPFEIIGLALGFGVKRRVINLYKFLCLNYVPGDRIFAFGFSRGAFTARLLVGLVSRQGLVEFESHEELDRNAVAAYRAYRSTVFEAKQPWTKLARSLRDRVIEKWNRFTGSPSYKSVRPTTGPRSAGNVPIAFLGVWDTVSAYGLPIDELTKAVDRWVWPMVLEKRSLLPNVEMARQALSLDDERRTFFPITWKPEGTEKPGQLLQVWFAGVHANVGGGYPDDRLAYVPLCWMIDEAVQAGLRFKPSILAEYRARSSSDGRIYDSRAGLGFFYRYHPRSASSLMDDQPPLVHTSVIERMAFGPDGYAPVSLSSNFKVRFPDERVTPFMQPQGMHPSAPSPEPGPSTRVSKALDELRSRHDQSPGSQVDRVDVMLDTVWWRRFVYYVLLCLLLVAAVYPLVAERLATSALTRLDAGAVPFIGKIVGIVEFLTPGFVKPWLTSVARHPSAAAILLTAIAVTMWLSAFLRTRIADRARIAWSTGTWRRNEANYKKERKESQKRLTAAGMVLGAITGAVAAASHTWSAAAILFLGAIFCLVSSLTAREKRENRSSPPLSFARFMRTNRFTVALYDALRTRILPAASLIAVGLSILFISNNVLISVAGSAGAFCAREDRSQVDEAVGTTALKFDPRSMCWDTGMFVLKDERYKITIDSGGNWYDASTHSGVAGFEAASFAHVLGWPLKRWWAAPYFQPIARIGSHGDDEQALEPIRIKGEPEAIASASFILTPKETGHLYLYVNDSVIALPGLTSFFYDNNVGEATVHVSNVSGY